MKSMKSEKLLAEVNFFVSAHRKNPSPVTVWYPRGYFPNTSLISLRRKLNIVCHDVQCSIIDSHDCLVIYDYKPENNND